MKTTEYGPANSGTILNLVVWEGHAPLVLAYAIPSSWDITECAIRSLFERESCSKVGLKPEQITARHGRLIFLVISVSVVVFLRYVRILLLEPDWHGWGDFLVSPHPERQRSLNISKITAGKSGQRAQQSRIEQNCISDILNTYIRSNCAGYRFLIQHQRGITRDDETNLVNFYPLMGPPRFALLASSTHNPCPTSGSLRACSPQSQGSAASVS